MLIASAGKLACYRPHFVSRAKLVMSHILALSQLHHRTFDDNHPAVDHSWRLQVPELAQQEIKDELEQGKIVLKKQ